MLFCSLHQSIHRSTRYGLLPVSPSQNHSSREEHPERRTPPKNSPENQWLPRAHHANCNQAKEGDNQEEQTKYTIYLLYVAAVGEDLRRVCRKFDIWTVFTTMSTLRQQLTIVKDTDPALKKSAWCTGYLAAADWHTQEKPREVLKPASRNIKLKQPPDKERQTSQQLQYMPWNNNTAPNGTTLLYLTTHGTTPPCWSRKHQTSRWQGNAHFSTEIREQPLQTVGDHF